MSDFERFKELQKQMKAYQLALSVASWDSNTEAPKASFPDRSEMLGLISGEHFSLQTSEEYRRIVDELDRNPDELNDIQKKEIKEAKKNLDKIVKIPKKDYIEFTQLVNLSQKEWETAKEKSDFSIFQPYLKKIIEMRKRMLGYRAPDTHPYDVLLDDFEEGMDREQYDAFFQTVKDELVPFTKKVLKRREDPPAFMNARYDRDEQKAFVEYLMGVFGFDFDKGLLKESVHPFTWGTHSKDVRFTVRYLEDYLFSSIFAAIHELGHALYEQQIDEMFDMTNLNGGASKGIHESQSRFYENMIGRSRAFWEAHLPALKQRFGKQLKDVDVETFYRAVNHVDESFIRVEADELTYPLHILLRYEIERDIFEDRVSVDELPDLWNRKMKEYLNIDVERDSDGILQDVHWSTGMFGYFPTYALGSAYAAQIYYTIRKEIDFDRLIREDNLQEINDWLREKIHCFGSSIGPGEILERVTGESFNPSYYVRYLKEKYGELFLGGESE